MYVAPKYIYFDKRVKIQDICLSCFLDDDKDITSKCTFKLEEDNTDITISDNKIKISKKPKVSRNKIIVLYEKNGIIEQDYAMAYIE